MNTRVNLFEEEEELVISELKVRKLYGRYNYDVSFNKDITMLYGTNGCGKTTILDIITSIITGSIYKLYPYEFDEICLVYYDEKDDNAKKSIRLIKNTEEDLDVFFDNDKHNIIKLQIPDEKRRRVELIDEEYLEEYPVLNNIRKEFNYVYLTLNRSTALSNNNESYFFYRRRYFEEDNMVLEPEKIDPEIKYVENLIYKRYMRATTMVNRINDEFRDEVLKSALDVNVQTDLSKFISETNIDFLQIKDIDRIKSSYVDIISDLNIVSDKEKIQIEKFFDEYSRLLSIINEKLDANTLFSLFIAYNEMRKIQKIVGIAEDAEKNKANIMKPIKLYLDTVNSFISTSDDDKKIEICDGKVCFRTSDNKKAISIQYMSSGERQLLVFFANLIFGVEDTSSGIFVVDEPELSLHLSWQKVFVAKALEVNNNVQFIFATHAPEIIGEYRDKAVNLRKIDSRKGES